ncbi:hypothetical protein FO519_005996 [Halicephalobus sp. NKZ332]|nr:hypothetical protein FO519_005996 [Halicephalobus sp. NKZ332]
MAPSTVNKPIGIDFGKLVYVPHDLDGFQLGKLRDIKSDGLLVELLESGKTVQISHDQVFPADDNQRSDVNDNCALMYLNEATLLHNCKTYVANILISINPYEQIPDLYSAKTIKTYMGKSLGTMPPHVFAIADMAYRDMKRLKRSQSVIVSGESGAGKTEAQKLILKYLCDCWGGATGAIEERLLETNPILEAFGNAKTLRNNNSSRFGKFVEIHFNSKFNVAGGLVSHYLLEKSRLCHQSVGERNYHIFYQLLAGSDETKIKEWHLGPTDKFRYLAGGCTHFFASNASRSKIPPTRCPKNSKFLVDEIVDDYVDFQRLKKSLLDTGLSESKRDNVFQTIAAILHLGNVEFEENVEDSKGGSMVSPASSKSLIMAAKLLGINPTELEQGLISRVMQPNKGGVMETMICVPLKEREAANARDALAKSIYNRLFDEIVSSINKSIPFTDSVNYIGVLDIAGFEFFAVNSFEQFCINYCNEKLQQFFNERILKHEQELYAKEGLNVPKIEFADNLDCIELFESVPTGLLDLLDEEARLPKPSPQHFTDCVHKCNKDHFRLTSPRKSKLREHRDMRDDEGFIIRHYAGSVCYQTSQFLDKNNDALHLSLEMLMEMSSNKLIQELFKPKQESPKKSPSRGGTKLVSQSVSSKFRNQLSQLLEKLHITGTHFVRCIKPNSTMEPQKFDGTQILSQLKCAGMASVLKLMQKGFPSRTSFADLYGMYKELLPSKLKQLDPRLFCKCLFRALGLNDVDYKFGMTRVFFRPGKFAEFDQLMKQDKDHMNALIAKVQSWLHRVRWKKVQYGAWSVIKLDRKIKYRAAALIKIQSALRGYKARKEQQPRLSAFKRALALQRRFNDVGSLGSKLSDKSKAQWVERIKTFSITTKERQEEMAREKKIKEMELQLLLEKEVEQERMKKMEQERLDAELAKRLAMEDGQNVVFDSNKINNNNNNNMKNEKYNLSGWTYPQLRDTINNSNDLELLFACRKELSNRLHHYHQWKANNLPASGINPNQRAPNSVLYAPVPHPEVSSTNAPPPIQRYFRVPFSTPLDSNGGQIASSSSTSLNGIWYAHFDGQFVARQMEIHPNKKPILLTAGKDDHLMCELTLDQTQLTRKKGVEIRPDEFENLWIKYNGAPYYPDNSRIR